MKRWEVSLEGFPTSVYDAEDREKAWDKYKLEHGDRVRRRNHDQEPVIRELEE